MVIVNSFAKQKHILLFVDIFFVPLSIPTDHLQKKYMFII